MADQKHAITGAWIGFVGAIIAALIALIPQYYKPTPGKEENITVSTSSEIENKRKARSLLEGDYIEDSFCTNIKRIIETKLEGYGPYKDKLISDNGLWHPYEPLLVSKVYDIEIGMLDFDEGKTFMGRSSIGVLTLSTTKSNRTAAVRLLRERVSELEECYGIVARGEEQNFDGEPLDYILKNSIKYNDYASINFSVYKFSDSEYIFKIFI